MCGESAGQVPGSAGQVPGSAGQVPGITGNVAEQIRDPSPRLPPDADQRADRGRHRAGCVALAEYDSDFEVCGSQQDCHSDGDICATSSFTDNDDDDPGCNLPGYEPLSFAMLDRFHAAVETDVTLCQDDRRVLRAARCAREFVRLTTDDNAVSSWRDALHELEFVEEVEATRVGAARVHRVPTAHPETRAGVDAEMSVRARLV